MFGIFVTFQAGCRLNPRHHIISLLDISRQSGLRRLACCGFAFTSGMLGTGHAWRCCSASSDVIHSARGNGLWQPGPQASTVKVGFIRGVTCCRRHSSGSLRLVIHALTKSGLPGRGKVHAVRNQRIDIGGGSAPA